MAGQEDLHGAVVIEEIPKGSALEKAGLLVGDVITAWKRLPNPPANPEAAEGAMASYFDWQELEMEQAPRGTVVLLGRRGDKPLDLTVTPGLWEIKVRPALPLALEAALGAGQTHLAVGDLEAAVRAWWSIAESVVGDDGGKLRAWVALRIGDTFREKDEWKRAQDAYREAMEGTASSSAQIGAWEALGKLHERQKEYEAAERAYSSSLKIRQKLNPESLGVASSLINLGNLNRMMGKLDHAYNYYLQALHVREKLAPESLAVANCLNNLGGVALARGELNAAHSYLSRALQIHQQLLPRSLKEAASLNNLGVVSWERGQLDIAHDYYLQALKIREELAPQSLEVAGSLTNLGNVARERGDLDHAHEYHLQAMRIYQQLSPTSLDMATCLNNAGSVAWDRGELDRAQDYHLRALDIRERLAHLSPDVAYSLNNLGAVALARGDLDRAYTYFTRALQIQEQLAPKSLSVATSLTNLGDVAWARRALAESQYFNKRALQIRDHLATRSLVVATSLDHLGDLALARRQLDRAQEYFSKALEIRKQLAPQSRDVADSLNHLGDVAKTRGNLALAHNRYLRALETLEQQVSRLGGSYNTQAGFRVKRVAFYRDLLDLILTKGRFRDAFYAQERFRAQTFLTMLAERDIAFTADIPEELDQERRQISVRYDRNMRKLAGLNLAENSTEIKNTRKELQKLADEAGDIEARIRQASPKLAALRYPQPLDAAAVEQALDPGTLLLSFSVGKKKTSVFALSRTEALELKTLPLGEESLRFRVKLLLTLAREAKGGSSLGEQRRKQFQAASRELYKMLLGPVADRIAASERLLILPDGPLHALPFAALVRDTKDGPQYLAAWKPLHVALSATVYAELKQRRHPTSVGEALQAPLQLAAFGDPVYPQSLATLKKTSTDAIPANSALGTGRGDSTVRGAAERGLFDFQPLPYTRREVLGIASLFPAGSARTFLGPEALEERIKDLDPKTRILHLAAHASIDEHLPSGSFIALTIPEETSADGTGPQRDNGLLQVWEIFERVRLNAEPRGSLRLRFGSWRRVGR